VAPKIIASVREWHSDYFGVDEGRLIAEAMQKLGWIKDYGPGFLMGLAGIGFKNAEKN
jgi:hypothetical protein